jgi:imidazolonepropionase-like amidohydrolase
VLPSARTEGPVVFEHVNLVRVQDGTTSRNVTLVVADGRVSPAEGAPRHARRIDAGGAYVIPGLWDMHVHVAEDASWRLSSSVASERKVVQRTNR